MITTTDLDIFVKTSFKNQWPKGTVCTIKEIKELPGTIVRAYLVENFQEERLWILDRDLQPLTNKEEEAVEGGWLVDYEDGTKEIFTETAYGELGIGIHNREKKKIVGDHHGSIALLVKMNPGTNVIW